MTTMSRRFRSLPKFGPWIRPHVMRVVYFPPPGLLWSSHAGDGSSASQIHKAYLRGLWRDRSALQRVALVGTLLLWPLVVAALAVWSTLRRGVATRRQYRVGVSRQLMQQVALAAAIGVLPPWYYIFELFDDNHRGRAYAYLHRFETKGGIFQVLRAYDVGVPRNALSNKVVFADWCVLHQLPHVPLLAIFETGHTTWRPDDRQGLPPADLFAKPVKGRGGVGARRWDYVGDGLYEDDRGRRFDAAALRRSLEELAREKSYLLQPLMRNHADLSDVNNGALSTVRIVTCRDERGGYEVTDAIFRMARGRNRTVDNFHAGGIAASADIGGGTLGPATDLGLLPDSRWHEVHPDTGAPIRGRRLPMWREACQLALRAHAAFCDRVTVGWDIAILPQGPCLVEGNGSPDVDIIQRVGGRPLGDKRFGQLLAYHLAHLATPVGRRDPPLDQRPAQTRSAAPGA